jgi:putative solute:sodium symporter small subunit
MTDTPNQQTTRGAVPDAAAPQAAAIKAALDRYWRANLRVMAGLLTVWALVSFVCGILIADWLNQFNLFSTGFPLGFWFAQQGSIATFVACILVYCIAMNRLDRRHHVELESLAAAARSDATAAAARERAGAGDPGSRGGSASDETRGGA